MAEKIFIADKNTQDLIKAKTDLIGSSNPTVGDTTNVMNYLKKLESEINQQLGSGYKPKIVGSSGFSDTTITPYNDSYILHFYVSGTEYIGLIDKNGYQLKANTNYPAELGITFNFNAGYAYKPYDGYIAVINLTTFAVTSRAITDVVGRSTSVFPMSDGNVLVVNYSKTKWYIYSPNLTILIKTIALSTTPSTNLNNINFEPKSKTIYFAGNGGRIDNLSYEVWTIDDNAGTATRVSNGSYTVQAGSNSSSIAVGIFITDNYALFYNYDSRAMLLYDRINNKLVGGVAFNASTNGIFSGNSKSGNYIAGLPMSDAFGAVFCDLGNDRFLMIKAGSGSTSSNQTGVIAKFDNGTIVPIKPIYKQDIDEMYMTYDRQIKMFSRNRQGQNGRLCLNGVEYDISDLIES